MASTIEQAREEALGLKPVNGLSPVIVKTAYRKGHFTYGVQFWSQFLITQGYSRNSDNTVARLVEVAK